MAHPPSPARTAHGPSLPPSVQAGGAPRPLSQHPTPAQRAAATRRRNKAEAVVRIRTRTAHEDGAVAVSPSVFVQAMLPHRETHLLDAHGRRVSVPTGRLARDGTPETESLLATDYVATNGAFTLTVRAGTRTGPSPAHPRVSLGVPSGGLARLLLAHVVTEAVRRSSPTVSLGRTLADLCRALDVTPSGGARGRLRYLFDQLLRLATCSASFQWETGTGYGRSVGGPRGRERYRGQSLLLVDAYDLWWQRAAETAAHGTAPPPTAGGTLTLGAQLWAVCQDGCVPVDWRKLQFLRDYPSALDLYLFLTHRLAKLEADRQPTVALTYDHLHAQLGSHYATGPDGRLTPRGKRDFGYRLRRALDRVRLLWPALRVDTPRGRFVLHDTGPDVPR